jgi:hypothetical protein
MPPPAEKPPAVAHAVTPDATVTPTKRQLLVAAMAHSHLTPEAVVAAAERASAAAELKAVRAGQPNLFKTAY